MLTTALVKFFHDKRAQEAGPAAHHHLFPGPEAHGLSVRGARCDVRGSPCDVGGSRLTIQTSSLLMLAQILNKPEDQTFCSACFFVNLIKLRSRNIPLVFRNIKVALEFGSGSEGVL